MFHILKKFLLFSAAITAISFACKKNVSSGNNFQNTKINFDKMCDKIQECYESYYRTIPPELQGSLTVANCKEKLKPTFEKKLALYSAEELLEFESCFLSMMDAPCKKFTIVSIADPVCTTVREKNKKAFSKKTKQLKD